MRAGAQTALVLAGLPRIARRLKLDRSIVLAYHNVVPDNAPIRGDSPLHIPFSRFRSQIEAVERTHRIVPLDQAVHLPQKDPVAAVTFDDAYLGAVRLGLPYLADRGLPAAMFVAPALLGGQAFWWDDLGVQRGSGLAPADRNRAVDDLAGRHQLVRECFGVLPADLEPEWRSASLETLRRTVVGTPISVGSHTWSHPNLGAVDRELLVHELITSKKWLEDEFGEGFRPWLSYPYGLSSREAEQAADAAGYQLALSISVGWIYPKVENRFRLPRAFIPGDLSSAGFRLRMAGFLSP